MSQQSQKNLILHLDEKLDFPWHLKEKTLKAQKIIRVINNLYNVTKRYPFNGLSPYFDYVDVIYV